MLLLIFALAQQVITLPVLQTGALEPRFVARMNEGGAASTKVRIVVSAEGVPIRCNVRFANGPRANGEALCAMLLREARYSPALGDQGRPMASVTYVWSQWREGRWLGSAEPEWDPVNLVLEVNKMPTGFPEMATFHLRAVVDPTGRIAGCEVEERGVGAQARELLCREASAGTLSPALDEKGVAMSSVQPIRVRLVSTDFSNKMMRSIRGH